MLIYECFDGTEERNAGFIFAAEIDVPKGKRFSFALKNWVKENGEDGKEYASINVLSGPMKLNVITVKEVVYA